MGRAIPAPYWSRSSVLPTKKLAHEIDRQNYHGHADQIGLQLLSAFDLQPGREIDLLDKELIETHGRDVEHGADQESVHVLHDLINEPAVAYVGSSMGRVKHSKERFIQQLDQTDTAKNEEARSRKRQAQNGYQDQIARLQQNFATPYLRFT